MPSQVSDEVWVRNTPDCVSMLVLFCRLCDAGVGYWYLHGVKHSPGASTAELQTGQHVVDCHTRQSSLPVADSRALAYLTGWCACNREARDTGPGVCGAHQPGQASLGACGCFRPRQERVAAHRGGRQHAPHTRRLRPAAQ